MEKVDNQARIQAPEACLQDTKTCELDSEAREPEFDASEALTEFRAQLS